METYEKKKKGSCFFKKKIVNSIIDYGAGGGGVIDSMVDFRLVCGGGGCNRFKTNCTVIMHIIWYVYIIEIRRLIPI